jgi:hypothetical protein
MMFTDARLEIADNVALTVTAISDVIDLGATPTLRSLALQDMALVITTTQAFSDGVADTSDVTIELRSDSATSLQSSPTTHWRSKAIVIDTLTSSGQVVALVPLPQAATYERYLGLLYTITDGVGGAGTFLTGRINALLVNNATIKHAYPDGI